MTSNTTGWGKNTQPHSRGHLDHIERELGLGVANTVHRPDGLAYQARREGDRPVPSVTELAARIDGALNNLNNLWLVADELQSQFLEVQDVVNGFLKHGAPPPPEVTVFTVKQACTHLGVSRTTLTRLRKQGLPCFTLGEGTAARPRFRRDELDAWIAKHQPRRTIGGQR